MATRISGSLTAANAPSVVFTAYEDFYLRMKHTTGASTVVLQQDLLDDQDWHTVDTFTTGQTVVVEVPNGGASKFRLMISTLDTGPVGFVVQGKLNVNDTIYTGGVSPGAYIIEEAGNDILDEDGTTKILEENA